VRRRGDERKVIDRRPRQSENQCNENGGLVEATGETERFVLALREKPPVRPCLVDRRVGIGRKLAALDQVESRRVLCQSSALDAPVVGGEEPRQRVFHRRCAQSLRLGVEVEEAVHLGDVQRGDMLEVVIDELLDAADTAAAAFSVRLARSRQPLADLPQSRRHEIGEDKRKNEFGVRCDIEQVRRYRTFQMMIVHPATCVSVRNPACPPAGWDRGLG
jgi:hypothetical protein